MPLKQQNRFCGVVIKQKEEFDASTMGFLKISNNYYLKSEKDSSFDGYIPEVSSFDHNNIAFYQGSWAVCERKNELLFLSRDRVGTRSIYYFESEDYFAFANDLKGLLSLSFITFKASMKGAFEFFYRSRTSSMVEGIQELPAGHLIKFDLLSHSKDVFSYYDFERNSSVDDESKVTEEINLNLKSKIEQTLVDCPHIASLLSGGIDSSVIASVTQGIRPIPYITGLSNEEKSNETRYAEAVVRHLEIKEWNQVVCENIDKEIENLHLAMELPTTSLGSFLQFEMMRFCKYKGISDVLDGTGADALYAGHNYYHAFYWNELLRRGKLGKTIVEAGLAGLGEFWPKYYVKNMLKYYYFPRFSISSQLKVAERNNPLLSAMNPDFVRDYHKNLQQEPRIDLKNLNTRLQDDFLNGGVTELLRFPDRIGKYFGVASHSIFSMYTSIFEYGLNIPSHFKISNGYSKYILRKAYEDKLPVEILSRKDKMGLVAPNNLWMREHKDLFLSYFDESLSDFFLVDKMRQMISEAIDASDDVENYKVFKFISFAVWYKVMSKWA